jgi:hypothetical protein
MLQNEIRRADAVRHMSVDAGTRTADRADSHGHRPQNRLTCQNTQGRPPWVGEEDALYRHPPTASDLPRTHALPRRFHGLRRDYRGSALSCPLTTRQASLYATDRSVAPTKVAFDAGLRPGAFPGQTASLLPGSLAITRTGPTPAGDDELLIRS